MRNLWTLFGLALFGDLVVAAGDIAAKRWVTNVTGARWYLAAAVCSYVIVALAWLAVLRLSGGHLGKAALFWVGTGAVVPVLIGRFLFGEVSGWNVWAGMACCAAGLVLAALP